MEAVVKDKKFAELNTVRKSIHEKYAFKQDDEGLRDFYRKVAGLVMNEKEKELLFHHELFSEEGVFVSDLKAAIRKIRQAFSENKKLKAVYFEYRAAVAYRFHRRTIQPRQQSNQHDCSPHTDNAPYLCASKKRNNTQNSIE